MLHTTTVYPKTLGLLKKIMLLPALEEDDLPAVFDATVTWAMVKKVIETEVKKL
jgi:hypothetical protein